MPEIPELKIIAKELEKHFKGEKIQKITVDWTKKLNASEDEILDAVINKELISVVREGKEIHLSFKNGSVLGIHLMLTGKMYLLPTEQKITLPIFHLLFTNGAGIAVSDPFGQAKLILNPISSQVPDVLSKDFTLKYFKNVLAGTRSAIKTVLTNQKKVRGIGNAYVDEILWHVSISPFSESLKIPQEKIEELYKAIPQISQAAAAAIEKNEDPEDIFAMKNKDHRFVHNSKRTHTPDGEKIKIGKVGTKKTYYTENQKIYK